MLSILESLILRLTSINSWQFNTKIARNSSISMLRLVNTMKSKEPHRKLLHCANVILIQYRNYPPRWFFLGDLSMRITRPHHHLQQLKKPRFHLSSHYKISTKTPGLREKHDLRPTLTLHIHTTLQPIPRNRAHSWKFPEVQTICSELSGAAATSLVRGKKSNITTQFPRSIINHTSRIVERFKT